MKIIFLASFPDLINLPIGLFVSRITREVADDEDEDLCVDCPVDRD